MNELLQLNPDGTFRGTNTDGSVSLTLPPAQVATTILTLAAAGQPVPEVLLAMLADGVLATPLPRFALEVRAGGDHQLARAIELAEAVLSECVRVSSDVGIAPRPEKQASQGT